MSDLSDLGPKQSANLSDLGPPLKADLSDLGPPPKTLTPLEQQQTRDKYIADVQSKPSLADLLIRLTTPVKAVAVDPITRIAKEATSPVGREVASQVYSQAPWVKATKALETGLEQAGGVIAEHPEIMDKVAAAGGSILTGGLVQPSQIEPYIPPVAGNIAAAGVGTLVSKAIPLAMTADLGRAGLGIAKGLNSVAKLKAAIKAIGELTSPLKPGKLSAPIATVPEKTAIVTGQSPIAPLTKVQQATADKVKYLIENPELPIASKGKQGISFDKKQSRAIELALKKPLEVPPKPTLDIPGTTPKFTEPIKMPFEQEELVQRAAIGEMKEPIVSKPSTPLLQAKEVAPPKPIATMTSGGEKRISQLAKLGGEPDARPFTPATTTSEYAAVEAPKQASKILRDQAQHGFKLQAEAEARTNRLVESSVQKYNIHPGSTESAAITAYGRAENKVIAQQLLINAVGPKRAEQIAEAERFLRTEWDAIRIEMNIARVANGEPEIPYLADYFTQMHEFNLLESLGLSRLLGSEQGTQLAQAILTNAEQVKRSKFTHLANIAFNHLKPQGAPVGQDAMGGFFTYMKQAHTKLALQPFVNELHASAAAVKSAYPNFSRMYTDLADHIAGKVPALDAAIQNSVGPEAFKALMSAVNNIKGNLIVGNMNVPLAQLFVLPNIVADLPVLKSVKGAIAAVFNPQFRNFLIENSPTIQLRLEGVAATKVASGKLVNLLNKPSNIVDLSTLIFGKSGKFLQLLDENVGVREALKGSEEFISRTQGTLTKINTAPILRSQTAQAALPFMNQALSSSVSAYNRLTGSLPMGEKATQAAKYLAMAYGVKQVVQFFLGDKTKKDPLSITQVAPFGSTLEQGVGGLVTSTAGNVLKAKTTEDKLLAVFTAVMLTQSRWPGGLQLAKLGKAAYRSIFPKKD